MNIDEKIKIEYNKGFNDCRKKVLELFKPLKDLIDFEYEHEVNDFEYEVKKLRKVTSTNGHFIREVK